MAGHIKNNPLVVITGPTASGKSDLAVEIAELCDGEIICADSRTVYRNMDIGTAKPTTEMLSRVPHWGIDIVSPGDYFSVADFKNYAVEKIKDIRQRGKTPFLVGGTGLYIDSVIFDFSFGPVADDKLRKKLQQLSTKELIDYCKKNNIKLPENQKNKRYLIRSIEVKDNKNSRRLRPLENTIIVGITMPKDELRRRIELRAGEIVGYKLIEETKELLDKYGSENEAMKANAYPLILKYLNNEINFDDVKNTFITLDWRLAKRQLTWLKRNKFIQWLSLTEARKYLLKRLAIKN